MRYVLRQVQDGLIAPYARLKHGGISSLSTAHRQSDTVRLLICRSFCLAKNRPITLVFSARLAIVRTSNMGQNLRNRVTQNLRSSPFWKDSGAAMKPSEGGESCIYLSSALCLLHR